MKIPTQAVLGSGVAGAGFRGEIVSNKPSAR